MANILKLHKDFYKYTVALYSIPIGSIVLIHNPHLFGKSIIYRVRVVEQTDRTRFKILTSSKTFYADDAENPLIVYDTPEVRMEFLLRGIEIDPK
jgi:hypothetical protein